MAEQRDLDIVIFGATGDTGIVGCCYLYFNGKKLGIERWAPAARNLGKLQEVVLSRIEGKDTGSDGILPADPIQADSGDYDSLLKMCARTKCVLTCAGPFQRYGEGVVKACVESGTDYVDITGEMPWVQKMKAKYGKQAEENGVRIVSCAGYDSVPPDLTTFLAAKALEAAGDRLSRLEVVVGCWGGAFPSGTIDTVLDGVDAGKNAALHTVSFGTLGTAPRKRYTKPSPPPPGCEYVPKAEQGSCSDSLLWSLVPGYSTLHRQFCVPHFMAFINVNVVHHTAAKTGYGGIAYRERMGGLPRGPMSLYGLMPALLSLGGLATICLLALLPYFSTIARKVRDSLNAWPAQLVREKIFDGYKSTGKVTTCGIGISEKGVAVNSNMSSLYDAGLGFTMLSACTVAAEMVKTFGKNPKETGFCSAVVAVGGQALAEALRVQGVAIEVTVAQQSRL